MLQKSLHTKAMQAWYAGAWRWALIYKEWYESAVSEAINSFGDGGRRMESQERKGGAEKLWKIKDKFAGKCTLINAIFAVIQQHEVKEEERPSEGG